MLLKFFLSRQAIPDAPVVYLVSPTTANVRRIAADVRQGLYAEHWVHFASPPPDSLLEELALACVEANRVGSIRGVWSRSVDFIALESDLFSLNVRGSFASLNDPRVEEAKAEELVKATVEGLVSAVTTLGRIPVLRANAASPAAVMVAERLAVRLTELLENGQLEEGSNSGERLLLVVDERGADLAAQLHHCPTYQALVQDCLPLSGNRVRLDEGRQYDLDTKSDAFWRMNRGVGWGEIGGAVKGAMESWKRENEQVMALQTTGAESNAEMLDKAEGLTQAVGRMGQVTEQKRLLDMHANIAGALAAQLSARGYVHLWKAEMELMRSARAEGLSLLLSGLTPLDDRVRLAIIARLNDALPRDELPADLAAHPALRYVEQRLGSTAKKTDSEFENDKSAAGLGWNTLWEGSTRVAQLLTSYSHGDSELLKLAAVVSVLQGNKASSTKDESDPLMSYLYLDPKQPLNPTRRSSPFDDCLLFVIGGGCYTEYQNVTAHARSLGRRVIYGTSELLSPVQFLDQLSILGKPE